MILYKGGDSPKAVNISNRSSQYGLHVSFTDILTHKTIRKIVEILTSEVKPNKVESFPFIDTLLEHGADINIIKPDNCTPLMTAALFHQFDTFQHLLKLGAKINVKG